MKNCLSILLLGLLVWQPEAPADVIIDMTYIGNAGNAADENWWGSHGSVNYDYRISTYEVTVAQYTAFLNAVATNNPNGLYSPSMGTGGGIGIPIIIQNGADGSYTYTTVSGTENQPVRYVSFYDATRFCNWLANGQGSGSTETGSYNMAEGYLLGRTANATWVIPTEDEWYKAAYYDPVSRVYYDYPNGSDTEPAEPTDETTPREMNFGDDPYWNPDGGSRKYFTQIGETTGRSPYGVADMGGNVTEWTETFRPFNYRITRGGHLFDPASDLTVTAQQPYDPRTEGEIYGLRLVYIIPEPSTVALLFLGSLGCVWGWMRRRV